MALTFPLEIIPAAINDRSTPEHSVSRFQSENGQDTRICYSCAGHSTSFSLEFSPLNTIEEAKLVKFFQTIGTSQNGSCRSFLIPDCWSGWKLIKTWEVWRTGLSFDSLDRHWWIIKDRPSFDGELCTMQSTKFTIENVHRRA